MDHALIESFAPNPPVNLGHQWIDLPDASEKLSAFEDRPALAQRLADFIRDGYVIFKKAVPDDLVDGIVNDMGRALRSPGDMVLKKQGKYVDPFSVNSLQPAHRVVDLYGLSQAARDAIFLTDVAEFLTAVFNGPASAIQSISFEYGSQQAMHQDTAYVISERPLALAASWIALEDIDEGQGELIYYPGSHRFDHFLFGGTQKGWARKQHGDEMHKFFLQQLHEQAEQRGLKRHSFLAEKGDVLIWHADLAHGGARRTNDRTRRSLVTHFVPADSSPRYKAVLRDKFHMLEHPRSGHFFTSRHYDLRHFDETGEVSVLYNPGLPAAMKSQR